MTLREKIQIKVFLFRLLTFLILIFVIDFLGGSMMRKAYFSQSNKFTYGIQLSNDEVIIVGSSRAQHHYIPSIIADSLDLSCFNMGSGGQNIYYSYGIIKSILERYSPKIIILDLISIDYTISDEAHNTDNLSLFLPYVKKNKILEEVINLRGPVEKVKLFSQIYPFNSQVSNLVYSYIKKDENIYFTNNGYVPLEGEFFHSLPQTADLEEFKIDTVKTKYIKKTIDLCNSHNVKLIMIQSPIYEYTKNKASPFRVVQRIAENSGIELWDYGQDSLFFSDSTFFKDVQHLNHKGAEKYTGIIASRIKRLDLKE